MMSDFSSPVKVEEADIKDELEDEEEEEEEDLEYDSSSGTSNADDVGFASIGSSKLDDKNNNKKPTKKTRRVKRLGVKRTYGLRPRTALRRPSYDCEPDDKEVPVVAPRREPRTKIRGTIVAKYRRLTANARERQRMKEINDAFTTLQGILPALQNRPAPSPSPSPSSSGSSRTSMTKIRTLRHAASYIQALSDLLSEADPNEKSHFHKDLQTYASNLQYTPITSLENRPQAEYCSGTQQSISKNYVLRSPDGIQESTYKGTFVASEKTHEGAQPLSAAERSISWEGVHTTDEELFSLLEKEVMCMRGGQIQAENAEPTISEFNWNEEIVSMGCK